MEWSHLSKMKVPCGSPQLTSDSTEKSWEFLFWDQRQHKEAHSPHSCATHANRLRQGSQTRKRDKGIQAGKKEIKLYADNTISYIKTHKNSTKAWLNLKNKSSKVAVYKMTIQDSVASLYAKYERSQKERKKVTPLTTASNTRDYDWGGRMSGHWKL